MSKMKHKLAITSKTVALIIFLGMMFFLPPGGSAENDGHGALSSGSEEFMRSATITIDLRTEAAIVSLERHYIMTENTIILDERGRPITLNQLPVPCEAVVKYELRMDQDPLCHEIILKKRIVK